MFAKLNFNFASHRFLTCCATLSLTLFASCREKENVQTSAADATVAKKSGHGYEIAKNAILIILNWTMFW